MARGMTVDTTAHQKLVEILTKARRRAKLQQLALAKLLDTSQTWVARIENGERRIDVIEFVRIARVLGLDPVRVLTKIAKDVK
jgi:transcriptional regulator with XRE-family HTH domain